MSEAGHLDQLTKVKVPPKALEPYQPHYEVSMLGTKEYSPIFTETTPMRSTLSTNLELRMADDGTGPFPTVRVTRQIPFSTMAYHFHFKCILTHLSYTLKLQCCLGRTDFARKW
jgi:hypothetical protein